ncbi:MFS transporter [Candidatus Bathyarchaeota archaeon]|nr:MAG: MFS transporter [Candidatus Bathyarchaeota archaeon]
MHAQKEVSKDSEPEPIGFRNVIALGFVSFFTDISSEMCFGILPAFILHLPGGTRAVLGVIEGLAEAINYLMRIISGVFSDRFRRRKLLVFIGYAVSNVAKPLFSVARTPVDALIVRLTDRVGKGVRTSPRDALISESVSGKRMGMAFGVHRTLDQLGAILGPALASAFMLFLGLTMRDVFVVSFIPGLMALIVLLVFVKERAGGLKRGFRILSDVRSVLKGRFPFLLLVVAVFSIGAFNYSFILLRAKELGIPEQLIPMIYAVVNVTHTAIATPAGVLSDRVGREKVLMLGYGVFLLSTLLLAIAVQNPLYGFLIAAVYGVYVGIAETVQRALVPSYAPSGLRATAYGVYYLVVGLAFLIANIVVGALWEYVNLGAVVGYSVLTSATAMVLMTIFLLRGRQMSEA